ncbi:MAG: S53 family peptidase [Ktedonobacteraceae bacterium]
MQAKPKHLPMLLLLVIVSCTSLAVIAGIPLLTWSGSGDAVASDTTFLAHTVQAHPVVQEVTKSLPRNTSPGIKQVQFPCQSNNHPQPMLCYGPYQIRQAYGMTGLLAKNITGQGSTITIIDAYGSPTIQQDLRAFDTQWGLTDPTLNVITPYGVPGTDTSWGPEVSVDVEWAHVMAPNAAINLVIAKSSNDVDLYYALKYTVEHNLGDVISLSFGENESCADSKLRHAVHQVLSKAEQEHITVLAATGDFGSAQYTCNNASQQQAVSFPADDPLITAVGGTTLHADAVTGQYDSEVAWNESDAFNKASGGGFSIFDARPNYQDGVTGSTTGRAVPDISLNASINGGVLVYQSQTSSKQSPITVMGGTSVGTPELAGLVADGVQMAGHRLGLLNPALYQLGLSKNYTQVMHDITSGDNILLTSDIPGYAARQGWDAVTGWGTPKQAETFLQTLISTPPTNTPIDTPTKLPTSTPIGTPTKLPTNTPTKPSKNSPIGTPTKQLLRRTKNGGI